MSCSRTIRSFFADGCRIAHSIEDALRIAQDHLGQTGGDEAMIIGGAILFEATFRSGIDSCSRSSKASFTAIPTFLSNVSSNVDGG